MPKARRRILSISRAVFATCEALEPRRLLSLTFSPASYPTGPLATSSPVLLTADFNGLADVIFKAADGTLDIMLGNGSGALASPQAIFSGNVSAAAVGDFNGDGKPDLAIACLYQGSNDVVVLLGNSDGTFQSPLVLPAGNSAAAGIAVGDFNGDGNQDIVISNAAGNLITFLGNGNGTFKPAEAAGVSAGSQLIAADFNGDGKLDLVSTEFGGSGMSILLGNGDGTFSQGATYGYNITSIAVADLNGDGVPDIVTNSTITHAGSTFNGVLEFLNSGAASFAPTLLTHFGTDQYSPTVTAGDFNGDDQPEVVAATNNLASGAPNALAVVQLNSNGSYSSAQIFHDSNTPYSAVAVADLNGDGEPDIIMLEPALSAAVVFTNTTTVPTPLAAPSLIAPTGQVGESEPAFSWSAVNGATSYRLVVSTNPFDLPSNPAVSLSDFSLAMDVVTSGTSFTPSIPLTAGVTYYWKVLATASGTGGTWSSQGSFTDTGLSAPTLQSPSNGAGSVSPYPQFSWSPIAGASTYRIIVATDQNDLPTNPSATTGGSSVVIDATSSSDNYVPTVALSLSTTYYWEVIATASGKGGTWSQTENFTTASGLSPPFSGFTPAQIDQTYGINQINFDGRAANGAGETIAIVDYYNNPNIVSDLASFDSDFNLPAPPSFKVLDEFGDQINPSSEPTPSGGNEGWIGEIDLDVEWAHAIAPGANIVLVETVDNNDIYDAITTAANYPGVCVVSMSFGGQTFNNGSNSLFVTPSGHTPVTFVAATGDTGIYSTGSNGNPVVGTPGIDYPAGFSNVLAVGGTSLTVIDSAGNWGAESLWSGSAEDGAGYGVSTSVGLPGYQSGIVNASGRSVPDVSFEADPNTGVAAYDSLDIPIQKGSPWTVLGGTSLATPAWAALIAIIDQGRATLKEPALDTAGALDKLYGLSTGDFHNTGSSKYTTGTGLGTPIVNELIPDILGEPLITSADTTTFSDGSSGDFTVTAQGLPTPSLSEFGNLPSGVSFVDNGDGTGALLGTPNPGVFGLYIFTLNVANAGDGSSSETFTLLVDVPVAFTSDNQTTLATGQGNTFAVTTTGFPTATLHEAGKLPSGISFVDHHNGAGSFAGKPAANTVGTYHVTLSASDGAGSPATQSFTLIVGQAPTITSANHATFTTGTSTSFQVKTTGVPTVTVTETGSLPDGVNFDTNAYTLSGSPTLGGTYVVTFTATNGFGSANNQTFTLTVDQPPALITSTNSFTLTIGQPGTFNFSTSGFPLPGISESGGLPRGVVLKSLGNGTAELAGTPSANSGKTYPITLSASNRIGATAKEAFDLIVDQPSAITNLNHTTFTVGKPGTFKMTVTGFPSATLTELGSLPNGVTFNSGTLAGMPAAGTGAAYPITLEAFNNVGATSTQAFVLTVTQPPAITSVNNDIFTIGSPQTFTITTTGYPLAGVLETGAVPHGLTFHNNGDGTATIAGMATGAANTYHLSLTASNSIGSKAGQAFTLVVESL